MSLSFSSARPPARAGAWPWRSRGRNQCATQALRSPGSDVHEAMEKLATADDIAAAVRAIAPTTASA
jgi:hypothetical protein